VRVKYTYLVYIHKRPDVTLNEDGSMHTCKDGGRWTLETSKPIYTVLFLNNLNRLWLAFV